MKARKDREIEGEKKEEKGKKRRMRFSHAELVIQDYLWSVTTNAVPTLRCARRCVYVW